MLEKIKGWFNTAVSKLPSLTFSGNLWFYLGVAVAIVILFSMFVMGWFGNWAVTGLADLPAVSTFFGIVAGTAALGTYKMLGKKFVDKDGNNISDEDDEVNKDNGKD